MSTRARTLRKERRWFRRYGINGLCCGGLILKVLKIERCLNCVGTGRVGWDEWDDDTLCLLCGGYGYTTDKGARA